MSFHLTSEPLGTRQMKWIDYWLWQHKLDFIPVKKMRAEAGLESFKSRDQMSSEVVFPIDHRYRFPGELIFDLDDKPPINDWHHMCDLSNDIYCYLNDELMEEPIVCHSGGGGFHIHIFKKTESIKDILLKKVVKELKLKRLIDKEVIDLHLLNGRHLIREIGGRCLKERGVCSYKSMVINPHSCIPVKNKRDVMFPSYKKAEKMKKSMIQIEEIEVG